MIDAHAILFSLFQALKFPLLFALAAVLFVYLIKKWHRGVKEKGAYVLSSSLFTPAEWLFYSSLIQAVDDQFLVFGKVRIADVLNPDRNLGKSDWYRAFNRISNKHFDFVLCDKITHSVVAAVELDDRSHLLPSAVARDSFVNRICKESELPLIRFRASSGYQSAVIRSEVLNSLNLSSDLTFLKSPPVSSN